MDLLEKGNKNNSKSLGDDPSVQFIPVSNNEKLRKKTLPCRSIFLTVLVIFGAVTTLTVILQVWLHLSGTGNIMRVFCGSMAISNQRFSRSYEDAKSIQFKELASKVVKQIKNIYGNVPLLSRYYIGSSVQAFSEFHDGSVIVYYMSEFHVPLIYVSTVDEVINSNDLTGMFRHTRKFLGPESDKALHIYNLVSGAMDLRLVNATLRGHYRHTHRCHRGKTGTIQSIGFSYIFYPRNIYTEWQLRADPGYRIRLKFIILNMEKDCHNNFIKVYDSLVPTEKQVLTEKCGYNSLSDQMIFLSSGNVMLLTMVTNGENNFPGFKAEYSQVPVESQECGGKLMGFYGTFKSPGFPSHYPPQTQCVWEIEVPEGKYIKVKFSKLSIREPGQSPRDCYKDYLEVNKYRMCGELPANKVHFSKTNRISVIFYSDMSYVDKGFSAEFEAVEPSEKCSGKFQCENDECIHSVLRCDGIDDCGDLSDEKNCVCKESDIKCKNGFCKPKYWRCDGVNDCGDNTDEENCGICRAGEITCRNNRCVSEHRKCDGHDDCGDGTDESECPKPIVVSCSEYTYKCRDNKCISKHNPQCDGDKDCEDGSDEIDCDCGSKPYKRSRIVGGQTSTEGEWPWQASLHVKGHGHACGASLISNRWMITAAHCVHDSGQIMYSQPDVWMVHLGLHTQGHYNRWTIHKNVKQIISHPDYDPTEFDNDIALIELDSPIKLSQRVWPICMPAATDQFLAGQSVWITGWGRISENGMLAKVLQKAQVRVINDTVCSQLMGNKVTPRMICAGVLNGGVDACQGDSGGPLSYIDMASGRWFLAGVVSWGDGCGRKSKPGIYSRVTKFRRWIRAKTGV
ncbi:ST14 transmembrane serine protease matriptase b [Electrophorus electricus]|uniref:ST14 transmembrane serine protease matriptase b n=1 Tax=Electrophorus electricus TaxID=8005 RepID=UPI0015CFFCBD|nr:ST14 transmembrane serine protease matriptase b [Electrophorus electricus]